MPGLGAAAPRTGAPAVTHQHIAPSFLAHDRNRVLARTVDGGPECVALSVRLLRLADAVAVDVRLHCRSVPRFVIIAARSVLRVPFVDVPERAARGYRALVRAICRVLFAKHSLFLILILMRRVEVALELRRRRECPARTRLTLVFD